MNRGKNTFDRGKTTFVTNRTQQKKGDDSPQRAQRNTEE